MKRKRFKKGTREDIYKSLNGRCAYCGELIHYGDMHMEHVYPLGQNGADRIENLLPSCPDCDTLKDNRNLEEFRALLENLANEITKDTKYRVAKKFGLVKVWSRPIRFYFETKNIQLDERKMIKNDNK